MKYLVLNIAWRITQIMYNTYFCLKLMLENLFLLIRPCVRLCPRLVRGSEQSSTARQLLSGFEFQAASWIIWTYDSGGQPRTTTAEYSIRCARSITISAQCVRRRADENLPAQVDREFVTSFLDHTHTTQTNSLTSLDVSGPIFTGVRRFPFRLDGALNANVVWSAWNRYFERPTRAPIVGAVELEWSIRVIDLCTAVSFLALSSRWPTFEPLDKPSVRRRLPCPRRLVYSVAPKSRGRTWSADVRLYRHEFTF